MKKTLKISQVVRKRVALLLLFNFLYFTILFAIPQEQCNGLCNVSKEADTCSMERNMAKSCCEMMGMNEQKSNTCDMEILDFSCDYELITSNGFTFIIPKIVDPKIVLTAIFTIDLDISQDCSNIFILSKDVIFSSNSPIYLTVSSFLI